MIMCEWMDRSLLSIALESMKAEFGLTDTQAGMMASASLWVVPFTVMFLGRLSDHMPRAKLLGAGVFGWGACTLATGSANSFEGVLIIRVLAGLSNTAGYPVAVSLLADFFGETEMTTAMGYFNAGCAVGGLLGMALGGRIITEVGWRWAFWLIGLPQVSLAVLLVLTVRERPRAVVTRTWSQDLQSLLRMPSLLLMMFGALLSGLMSGNHRFISALAQRVHHVSAETVGLVMGVVLGITGIISAWGGGHAIDRLFHRRGDSRVLLWCASASDIVYLAFGTFALLSPSFEFMIILLAFATAATSLGQGIDTANQMLGRGRRGTAQALMECSWSVGMGIGPFLAGALSDSFHSGEAATTGAR
jgi:predicted MFS family arabinose efflux permease